MPNGCIPEIRVLKAGSITSESLSFKTGGVTKDLSGLGPARSM